MFADLGVEFEEARRGGSYQYLGPDGPIKVRENILIYGNAGFAAVKFRGRRYDPDPDGTAAILFPVLRMDHVSNPYDPGAEQAGLEGDWYDILAFPPHLPERWATRDGKADWIGWPDAEAHRKETWVWRSPLSFMRMGHGIMLLDCSQRRAAHLLKGFKGGLLAQDIQLARQLKNALSGLENPPPVMVGQARSVAA